MFLAQGCSSSLSGRSVWGWSLGPARGALLVLGMEEKKLRFREWPG